jgi:uncharacterized protein YbcI
MATSSDRGRMLTAVTNAIVAMHREFYGRGATRGRTIMQDDYLVCFLHDIYTKAQRTLIEAGKFQAVLQARNAFQEAMRPRFSQSVEELTGRRVVAFVSQVGTDPDVAVEAFWLEATGEPDGAGDPPD